MHKLPEALQPSQEPASVRQQVFSLLSNKVQTAILNISDEFLMMNEAELETKFKPSNIDFMLRRRLWQKFREAELQKLPNIPNVEIYRGICTDQNFYDFVLKNQVKLAWLIHPVQDPDEMLQEAYEFALKKVREILHMPIDSKSAPSILKAADFLANRAKGGITQRLETKNLHVGVGADPTKALTNEEINKKLLELQDQMQISRTPRDVNVEDGS